MALTALRAGAIDLASLEICAAAFTE